jgi:hypothetical protein
MTSLVDTLERRGLVERHAHLTDRRKVLIHLTADAQRIVDQQLPVLHAVIAQAISERTMPTGQHDNRPPPAILLACASLAGRHQR